MVAAWAGRSSSSRTLAWNSDVLHCAQQLQAAAGRGYNPLRDTGQGCMAGWQYGGGADTRCWLHVEAARWPGVGRGRVARVQLVSRCWVWPGCVSNMKDMTCASSSRARPDPDKWPPAQPAQPSPAQPRQQYYRLLATAQFVPPPRRSRQAACAGGGPVSA